MKKKIISILLVFFGGVLVFTWTGLVDCIIIRKGIANELGTNVSNIKVEYDIFQHQVNAVIDTIELDFDVANKAYTYWSEMLESRFFIVNRKKCDYMIWVKAGDHNLGDSALICISNSSSNDGNTQWSNLGKDMLIQLDYTFPMPTEAAFDDVKKMVVRDYNSILTIENVFALKSFTSLECLDLGNGCINQELLNIIQDIVPKECVITGYTLSE